MYIKNPDLQRTTVPLPKRISRLFDLATNLWWSWQEDARQVFRSLDYPLWRTSGHNPVRQLLETSPERLQSAAADPAFLELYDGVMARFDADMAGRESWFHQSYPDGLPGPVAYFSAEFAIHRSLPIYAGGLGILAGDICKEASDLGLPLIGVGFMYPQGYFHQRISAEGWQEESYIQLNFREAPIFPCPWPEMCGPLVPVHLADRTLQLAVWLVRVGRVNLYLLDTNVEENAPQDRLLSARLYTADVEQRMQQLVVLGRGGVQTLRMLGANPSVWHANEDHTAFMILERLREEVQRGASFQEAIETVRTSTVFTTHTPVPAGHSIFPIELLERFLGPVWQPLGIDRETFLRLGQHAGLAPGNFSLTAFALRLAGQSNGVSRLHGHVARRMWHVLWPDRRQADVPIGYITNGVHLPTWQASEVQTLCRKYLGAEWQRRQDDPELWKCLADVPDEEFWEVRQLLKTRLFRTIEERAQQRWIDGTMSAAQVVAMGALLDPYALTIVFARRFTEYKRPALILHDVERLKKIVTDPLRPIQIVFAGKSHPADVRSKALLQEVYRLATDRGFQGRIAFVEDYDMGVARDLVRGADVWLNTPRRLQEASGTSGMKAAMNGALNLSIRDGWWDEGYTGANGWAIDGFGSGSTADQDRIDAEALYGLLENEIAPLYYDRDRRGVPHRWIALSKEAIRSISPTYCSARMLKDYTRQMYLPALSAVIR